MTGKILVALFVAVLGIAGSVVAANSNICDPDARCCGAPCCDKK